MRLSVCTTARPVSAIDGHQRDRRPEHDVDGVRRGRVPDWQLTEPIGPADGEEHDDERRDGFAAPLRAPRVDRQKALDADARGERQQAR